MRIEQFASLHEGPLLLLKATPTRVLILAIAYEPLFFIIHFICSFCFLSLLYLFTSLFVPIRLLFLCLSMSTNAPTLLLLLFLFHQKTIYYFPYIHAVISLRFVYLRRPLFSPSPLSLRQTNKHRAVLEYPHVRGIHSGRPFSSRRQHKPRSRWPSWPSDWLVGVWVIVTTSFHWELFVE